MSSKAWSEAEKLGLLFQIIERAGTIPWDDLKLPEGRTKKACMVMVDKEKQKVKKQRVAEAGGEDPAEASNDAVTTQTPKRKAAGKAGTTKKSKKVKAGEDDAETNVKAEPEGDDILS